MLVFGPTSGGSHSACAGPPPTVVAVTLSPEPYTASGRTSTPNVCAPSKSRLLAHQSHPRPVLERLSRADWNRHLSPPAAGRPQIVISEPFTVYVTWPAFERLNCRIWPASSTTHRRFSIPIPAVP